MKRPHVKRITEYCQYMKRKVFTISPRMNRSDVDVIIFKKEKPRKVR
jgi:hypothetical protein